MIIITVMKLILLLLSFSHNISPVYEHQDDDKVTLTCSVLKYEHCQDTVEWLYDGNSDDFTNLDKGSCKAAVTFTASNLNQKSHYSELFKCKVTERTLLCNVTPQSSCEKHSKFFLYDGFEVIR